MKHMTFPEFLLERALRCEDHLTFPDAVFGAIWKSALDADDVFRVCHFMASCRYPCDHTSHRFQQDQSPCR